jgi:hypothetical protein
VCADARKKRSRKLAKLKRQAIARGAAGGEAIDPIKVFERDKWKCQLCGTRTPKKKRGTYDDNAPELDHILPVSKGGQHRYTNVQCACRRCNGMKNATPLGQMLLFG